ncbi:protein-L-isoaspartate O-methyltransferase [Streptosporangium carneum]|uniref:Protein-L-isoaspartate O-methyltransferase n=1 Tax=Streptosporangium carneum TaxID=47481 RepID=A0A9W6HXQ6_9ACTN|nr:protein-L-isoaspartate O-methyltransferase [Streptosporangium carneum]
MIPETGRRRLRDLLVETGVLTSDWMAAYEAAPRELFLPDVMWPDGGIAVSKLDDPEEWRYWADADVPIATQWDDGRHTGTAPGEVASSSSSAPSLVFWMLAELSVFDGAKVLEVGTGTGWCAALLSARLGEENVVSVEVDEAVAETAREALASAGWHPRLVVGDGLLGWPEGAPYDRILVTAGVRQVPRVWIEQTRPGGVLVMPWGTHYSGQSAAVRLAVADDGTASGRFFRATRFMRIRAQRLDWPAHEDYLPPGDDWPEDTRRSTTALPVAEVVDESGYAAFDFVTGLLLPECVHTYARSPSGTMTMWLYGLGDRSWAAVYFDEDDPAASRVYQGGPRGLWDEVEAAHRWWAERGRPGHEEFGLTVTADGRQQVWLREPSALVPQAVRTR